MMRKVKVHIHKNDSQLALILLLNLNPESGYSEHKKWSNYTRKVVISDIESDYSRTSCWNKEIVDCEPKKDDWWAG